LSESSNTVLEILRKSEEFLAKKQVSEPKLSAQHILAHVLGLGRMDLYLQFDRPLKEIELEKIRPLLARRAKHEPLQYLIGHTGFRKLNIKCDPRALIPRPETEQLIDLALESLKDKTNPTIIEMGVGTGAILLSLACEFGALSTMIGVDISALALQLAQENHQKNHITQPVTWLESDLWSHPQLHKVRFDLLVSNPPYIDSKVMQSLQPDVRLFEPHLALDGGKEGMELIERMLSHPVIAANKGSTILLESGYDHKQAIEVLCQKLGFSSCEILKDFDGHWRFARIVI
jgi:release factor glutamine methyltransferase